MAPNPVEASATVPTDADKTSKPVSVAAMPMTDAAALEKPMGQYDQPVIIDNDEQKYEATYAWKEIPDDTGKTKISAGARFPVVIESYITSKDAKVGDAIEGRTQVDLRIGGRLVAAKGSCVVGHVSVVHPARKMIAAELCPNKRWMRPAGSLSIQLDEIINQDNEHIPLVAQPARQPRIVKNVNEGRVLGVNHKGEIASPLSTQVKHQLLHIAIRAGASAGGVFSMGAVPVAYAAIGAINPSFAFMQPVGKNVRHRRLKGAGLGLLGGLPGGFLIADSIVRGPESIIKPGDVFEAEFKQDFTGEPSTTAELLDDAHKSVHGEIRPKEPAQTP